MRYEPEQCDRCDLWFPPGYIDGATCKCLSCATDGACDNTFSGCEEEWEVCRHDENYDPTPDDGFHFEPFPEGLTKDQIRRGEGL